MFDFIDIRVLVKKPGKVVIYPEFINGKNKDLMIRGGDFYAFWDEAAGFWKTDQNELIEQIDKLTLDFANEYIKTHEGEIVSTALLKYNSSGKWAEWVRFRKNCNDNYNELDRKLIFSNEPVSKKDYVTKTLPYPIVKQDISAYEELMDVLYDKSEREKIEWAIGSIITGECVDIQKFYVLYGAAGTGKSTVLTIIQDMFSGYWKPFVSADLGNASAQFAMESLKDNPIIAIEHDGDLSRIDSNARLNSIISHEPMIMNEKRKNQYQITINSVMFIGTNKPVRITDSKSGLLRRLIDISPSGRRLSFDKYQELMAKIAFEYGGIAYHCKEVYEKRGMSKYLKYRPTIMIDETNDMYNFVQEMLWDWEATDKVTLASAWQDYQKWVEDANTYKMKKRTFKSELKDYFNEFHERLGQEKYVYAGIKKDKFSYVDDDDIQQVGDDWLDLKEGIKSKFDKECMDCYAQYATDDEIPGKSWKSVTSRLRELDTSKLHYVKVPENHIVIDFDIKNENGEKDFDLNKKAASKFPKTYAEVSKGGQGIHLHYIYTGDVSKLSAVYDADIEVKVFRGGASLRRRLTKCNDIPIATIGSGLPLKEEKPMVSKKAIENERHLIVMIKKCLNKEHHGHTAPEVDFMKLLTDQAYMTDGLSYDIRSMKPAIVSFAMNSTNQAQKCFDTVSKMHLCSKDVEENEVLYLGKVGDDKWQVAPIVFFDVEVFPNLFVICWKLEGSDTINKMINPSPKETEELFKYRLVGFNCRRYDNHILYARAMGYSLEELFRLSQRIVSGSSNAFFGSAYNLSYTDIYDYCSNANKMSLKKWEIKLGIYHLENQYKWDEPISEDKWDEIANYCCNDVKATEAVWEATQDDFNARCILAELSGLTVNDTSNAHTQQFIFGDDKHPQSQFNCPDLSIEFPGYEFKNGVSTYLGEKVSEGGWVFFKPGMYKKVKCFDVSGMHPHSAYAMKIFGDYYTERYYDLVRARTYIKHKEYDKVRKMFDGKLAKYLKDDKSAKQLSNALKTPINSVYGLTCARFENRCRDPRNKDNIVAKRGALFMITLKHKLDDMGYEVIHCKTDSIKVVNPDSKVEKFIMDFGKKYGYTFEVEDVFDRICLVNGSTFIAKIPEPIIDKKTGKEIWWEAKAAQFAHPYVFKNLFTHEDILFEDLCETKNVSKGALYLDLNENLVDVSDLEKALRKILKDDPDNKSEIERLTNEINKGHDYRFVGKIGLFTPMREGVGAGYLMVKKDPDVEKYDAVSGTKGYKWYESQFVKDNGITGDVDMSYFENLVADAIKAISNYGDFDIFANGTDEEFNSYMDHRDSGYESVPIDFSEHMAEPQVA